MKEFIEIRFPETVSEEDLNRLVSKQTVIIKTEGVQHFIETADFALLPERKAGMRIFRSGHPPDIPFSILHAGKEVEVIGWRHEVILTAKVVKRWFKAAVREDWSMVKDMEKESATPLRLEKHLTVKEYDYLSLGMIPLAMEDKWFRYSESQWLHFHRSWSGEEIYKVRFEPDEEGYRIAEAWLTTKETAFLPSMLESFLEMGRKRANSVFDTEEDYRRFIS